MSIRKRANKPHEAIELATLYKEVASLRKELSVTPGHIVVKAGNSIKEPGKKIQTTKPSKIRYQPESGQGASQLVVLELPENFTLKAPFTRAEVVEGEIVYTYK